MYTAPENVSVASAPNRNGALMAMSALVRDNNSHHFAIGP